MIQERANHSKSKKLLRATQEELKRLRLAEMDAAYRKELKTLTNIVRSSRINIRHSKRS